MNKIDKLYDDDYILSEYKEYINQVGIYETTFKKFKAGWLGALQAEERLRDESVQGEAPSPEGPENA